MIESGAKPTLYDRRDHDLLKTFGAALPPKFPDYYNVDNGLWTPNQNAGGELFNLPPQPYGCTNFTTCDISADDDGVLYNPQVMEERTRANAKGGLDIRVSLKEATKRGALQDANGNIGPKRTGYFTIRPTQQLDVFDAIRLAMLSTQSEGRSVSAGTPFYPDWMDINKKGILSIPKDFNTSHASWHNWKVSGWKMINDQPYLICKMWLGKNYGDKGFVYMSRPLANSVFNIPGSCAFTVTKLDGLEIQTVDFKLVQWIVSFIKWTFSV